MADGTVGSWCHCGGVVASGQAAVDDLELAAEDARGRQQQILSHAALSPQTAPMNSGTSARPLWLMPAAGAGGGNDSQLGGENISSARRGHRDHAGDRAVRPPAGSPPGSRVRGEHLVRAATRGREVTGRDDGQPGSDGQVQPVPGALALQVPAAGPGVVRHVVGDVDGLRSGLGGQPGHLGGGITGADYQVSTTLMNRPRATPARTGEPAATATSGHRPASTTRCGTYCLLLLVTEHSPEVCEVAGALSAARAGRAGSPATGSGPRRPWSTWGAGWPRRAGPAPWQAGRYRARWLRTRTRPGG